MYPHHWETSWMSQGMGYCGEIALDSVGRAKRERLRKEQAKGDKRAIFIYFALVDANPKTRWIIRRERVGDQDGDVLLVQNRRITGWSPLTRI
jgi:hypothetical protein